MMILSLGELVVGGGGVSGLRKDMFSIKIARKKLRGLLTHAFLAAKPRVGEEWLFELVFR